MRGWGMSRFAWVSGTIAKPLQAFDRHGMRTLSALFALLLGIPLAHGQAPVRQERGNLIFEGIPARDAALGDRLQRYLDTRRAVFLDWLPDGGMLVATRFGDAEQVHRV